MDGRSLEELTHADDQHVRRRARLVRDTLSLGPTRAARQHGVTRQTAAKWAERYRAGGTAELQRSARRRRGLEETRHAVLTAPLWMPTARWSSRSIAATLGVSQSYVARTWEKAAARTALTNDLDTIAQGTTPEPLALLVTPDYAVLVFQVSAADDNRRSGRLPVGPAAHRALRTVLAADLVRQLIEEHPTESDLRSFWEQIRDAADSNATVVAIASREAPPPPGVAVRKVCRDASEWQSLITFFAERGASPSLHPLHEMETELRTWYRDPHSPFTYVARGAAVPGAPAPAPDRARVRAARSTPRHVAPERALADQIVVTIRQGVVDGRLAAGDRVTERHLAGRLHTTRGQVRSALRLLERDGLLTVTSGRAAVVPIPTVADVVETYAARRALGAIMVRAAGRWTPAGRALVTDALDVLEQRAASGDLHRTSQADIDFQDALAEASGLARIGPMLQLLAEQLRMFIAVMGLDYAFPIDSILDRDRRIFAAIDAADEQAAVEQWRAKVDDAAAYMLEQLQTTRPRSPGEA
jgi:DNA-binding GntR family transcriptional regulator